jgi:hypothetical protein
MCACLFVKLIKFIKTLYFQSRQTPLSLSIFLCFSMYDCDRERDTYFTLYRWLVCLQAVLCFNVDENQNKKIKITRTNIYNKQSITELLSTCTNLSSDCYLTLVVHCVCSYFTLSSMYISLHVLIMHILLIAFAVVVIRQRMILSTILTNNLINVRNRRQRKALLMISTLATLEWSSEWESDGCKEIKRKNFKTSKLNLDSFEAIDVSPISENRLVLQKSHDGMWVTC